MIMKLIVRILKNLPRNTPAFRKNGLMNKEEGKSFFSDLDYKITRTEIRQAVPNLKNNKGLGKDDHYDTRNDKDWATYFIRKLAKQICNSVLCPGTYSDLWKEGITMGNMCGCVCDILNN